MPSTYNVGLLKFFVQLFSSWQDFNWNGASGDPSPTAKLLRISATLQNTSFTFTGVWPDRHRYKTTKGYVGRFASSRKQLRAMCDVRTETFLRLSKHGRRGMAGDYSCYTSV